MNIERIGNLVIPCFRVTGDFDEIINRNDKNEIGIYISSEEDRFPLIKLPLVITNEDGYDHSELKEYIHDVVFEDSVETVLYSRLVEIINTCSVEELIQLKNAGLI